MLRQFAPLAHAYSRASHEIGLLKDRSSAVRNDAELARFVSDCEAAFSREHIMWRARREAAEG